MPATTPLAPTRPGFQSGMVPRGLARDELEGVAAPAQIPTPKT
jgi:hypothetical protein